MLRLYLLGGLDITLDGAELRGFVSRKTQALLVFLAVTGRAHRREALAGLLWGNRPQERAAGDLRVALSNLRTLVPGYCRVDRQTIALETGGPLWIDALELERIVRQSPDDLAELERVQELYRGPFLEGFHLRDAPAFEEWVLVEQERCLGLARQSLRRLAQGRAARGEYAAAIAAARRLVALDPWHEEAHRELMGLLALSGQRSAALSQYEDCRRLLAEELGLEPLEETIALYERIRDAPTALAPAPAEATAWGPAGPPFVGRQEEHACLVQWWETARRGGGRLTLVAGEAGVGKTRLVEEVLRYAASRGAVVLRGRCYEFGGGLPYQAIAQALRQGLEIIPLPPDPQPVTSSNLQPATRQPVTSFNLQPGSLPWLSELVSLLPELRDLCPGLPPPLPADDETARQRLFEAVARFIGQRTPGILFLDDLHWADPATIDLLHYLSRQTFGQQACLSSFRNSSSPVRPLWVVGTYRAEEVDLEHPLERLRQGLGRDHLVERLVLEPLALPAVQELAGALVGGAAGPALGDLLYQESRGNPLFLVETVAGMWEEQLLQGDSGALHWAGPPAAAAIPRGIQDVVLQRVGRLTRPARRLLALAAVIGRPFDLPLLQAAAGPDAAAVAHGLDEWLLRRIVHLQPATCQPVTSSNLPPSDSGGYAASAKGRPATCRLYYDFTHDQIRAVVYGITGTAQRKEHHREIGKALERLHGEQAPPGELAYHYERAGLVERALHYLPLAAAQARAVYAHQEALAYYERALALAAGRPERWPLQVEHARTLRLLSRYDEAAAAGEAVWRAWEEGQVAALPAGQVACELSAIETARRDYDAARSWADQAQRLATDEKGETALREQARARQSLAAIEQEQGRLERAQQLFQEARAIHEQLGDPAGRAACLKGLGHVLSRWGRYDESRQYLEQALTIFRELDDRQNEATCRRMVGIAWWRQGQHEAARQAYAQSMAICQTIGDRTGEAAALNGLGLAAIAQGDQAETLRCWEESVALYRALGLEKRAAAGLHNLGILHLGAADYAQAQQCLEESLALDRSTADQASASLDLGWLGRLHLLRGDYEDARRCLDEALALDQEIGGGEEETGHLAWRGTAAYETGDWAGALAYLERSARLSQERGMAMGISEACALAQVYLAQGDGPAALAAIRPLLPADEDQHEGLLYALLGVLHGSGLPAEAEDPAPYFERALALLRGRDPWGYGVALRRYGAYLLRRGQVETGRSRLHEALAVLERIGARGEAEKVARLLTGDESPQLAW